MTTARNTRNFAIKNTNTDAPDFVVFETTQNKSGRVLFVGLLIVAGIVLFILKNWHGASLLLSVGVFIPSDIEQAAREEQGNRKLCLFVILFAAIAFGISLFIN